MSTIHSSWAETPIQLTDSLNDAVWQNAGQMMIPGGFLLAKNDGEFLYAAIDLTQDPGNDPPDGDYFWFTFDTNRNGVINPMVDINYGVHYGNPDDLGKQYYLGPGMWTGITSETISGCKQTFESSPNLPTAHRVWKLRFKLSDIHVSLHPSLPFRWWHPFTKFGIRVNSDTPSFTYDTPNDFFENFSRLHTMYFSRKPSISSTLLGPVMGSVGLIPTTQIDTTSGRATTASGYYVFVENAAFGGTLNIIGNRTQLQALTAAGAVKYKVNHRQGTSGSFNPLISNWYNYEWTGSTYTLVSFSPDSSDNYSMPNPFVDYSIDDLLIQFDSNTLSKGIHQFQVVFYDAFDAVVAAPAQTLTLFIDNNAPQASINSIQHDGAEVNVCSIVYLDSDTDGLVFNITASDPDGNVESYALDAGWGNNQSETIVSDSYSPITMGNSWNGVTNLVTPSSGVWVPEETCAYGFTLTAWARTTNGYSAYIYYNQVSKYITLIFP